MKKIFARIVSCLMIAVFVWLGALLSDRKRLGEELIRIHVVAHSDSPEDQGMKLQVRDAVLNSIQADLRQVANVDEAKLYLQDNLPQIQKIACNALAALGCGNPVTVTLGREAFERKAGAFYTLPAGIYESLRITIGSGQGKNWWSVVFPDVCCTVTKREDPAQKVSGFPDSLEDALTDETCSIRFYFLDLLGRMENIFIAG